MLNSRQRAAVPALEKNTSHNSNQLSSPSAKDVVLSIDPTARFYHYGPQGCASGWVKGKDWETAITFNEKRAWENARTQLAAREPQTPAGEVELTPGGMYPNETDAQGKTLHSRHCKAAFNRRDWQCFRCCELLHGSAPREGWQRPFFAKKLRQIQRVLLFPHPEAEISQLAEIWPRKR
jgi:hypothetical protein